MAIFDIINYISTSKNCHSWYEQFNFNL